MYISDLKIRDFRCFSDCQLSPGPGINIVLGDNATGKSSLLEAIFYLGRGHSFRRSAPTRIIRRGTKQFTLNCLVEYDQRRPQCLGVQRETQTQRFKVGTQDNARALDLVQNLPLQIIDPNIHRLLEEGPDHRRRYLDWGVFHVEHEFYPAWLRYRRALRQRNSALRNGLAKTAVVAWDSELVNAGQKVDACRRGYVDALAKILPAMVNDVLGGYDVALDYRSGWPGGEDFGETLLRSLDSDTKAGFTHSGPHRADLRVSVASVNAKDWVSRGQQKLLTASLLLAQAKLLSSRRQIHPILLIDDLAAELGETYRHTLLKAVRELKCQCFLSFLEPGLVPDNVSGATMFHVEHGGAVRQA